MNKVRLGDYVKIKTGKLDANASSPDGEYPFFTCAVEPLKIDSHSYDCECVLVAGNGDLNVKYYDGKFDAYQRTYIIESKDKTQLSVPYLYRFLDAYIDTLRNQSIGGVIKYIKLGNLTEARISVPAISEQNKTVKILSFVDELLEKANLQLQKLDELIKSLFVEMFGDPNHTNWKQLALGDCLVSLENGKSYVCDSISRTGINPAILKLSAVTYGRYDPDENKSMVDRDLFDCKLEVKDKDLLFTRKNTPELVGMSAYVFTTPKNLMMPDLIFRLNTKDSCNAIYLWQLINHELFRNNIRCIASGTAKSMSNISKERLCKLIIPLPPFELQNQFADFVTQVEKQKATVQQSIEKLETLKKSLMQEFFW